MTMEQKKEILYILTKDDRLVLYGLRNETNALVKSGNSITVFKKRSLGELGFIEHPEIKITPLSSIFFRCKVTRKVLADAKGFHAIHVDDKKLFDSLARMKRLRGKNIVLIPQDHSAEFKMLDVGCGGAKSKGAIGIDRQIQEDVNVVSNLNKFPWPLKNNTFDVIYCISVIEHLDDIVKTMEELHRIGKNGAVIIIDTSHFAHPNSYRDPTHKWHFTLGTFDYFTGGVLYPRYSKLKFKMLKKELHFRKKYCTGKLYAFFSTRRYEKYYCHKCPPHSIYFEMEIVKD